MGFGGSAADMLFKMKYNKSLRDNNRDNYNRYMDAVVTYKKTRLKIESKNISKEDLEKIKIEVRNEVKKRTQIAVTLTIIFTLISTLVIGWLFWLFYNSEPTYLRYF